MSDTTNQKPNPSKFEQFLVNRSGFPIDQETWSSMWKYIETHHVSEFPELANKIRWNGGLPLRPILPAPHLSITMTVPEKISVIQNYFENLQYNHTGLQFFEIKKNRPLSRLTEIAKEMIKESLPIKCLEATILGIYLTSGISGLDRFSISFKSQFGSSTHRHVVLGLHHGSYYGTIGLSRRKELMDRSLSFKTLADLVMDFSAAYSRCHHKLRKVKISNVIVHDCHSMERIHWDFLTLPLGKLCQNEIRSTLDKFSRELRISKASMS